MKRTHWIHGAAITAFALAFILTGCSDGKTDPCKGVVCNTPPAAICEGDTLVTFASIGTCEGGDCVYAETRSTCDATTEPSCQDNVAINDAQAGTCAEDAQGARCVYQQEETDCTPEGLLCQVIGGEAVCVDPCEGVTCPPREDYCDLNTAFSYQGNTGTCQSPSGDCLYPAEDETIDACGQDEVCMVVEGRASCHSAALTCADLEPCQTPPSPHCSGGGIVTYAETGICDDSGEVAVCVYSPTTTLCNIPPEHSYCDNDVRHLYNPTGTCGMVEAVPQCQYGTTSTDCSVSDQVCWVDGAGEADCWADPAVQLCQTTCDGDDVCSRPIDLCVEHLNLEGSFCGMACAIQSDCPNGFDCLEVTSVDNVTALQCVPLAGFCVTPVCGLASPPSVTEDGGNCHHPGCQNDPACEFGSNFDFENWLDGRPVGFYLSAQTSISLTEETASPNTGLKAAHLESTVANGNRDLLSSVLFTGLVVDAHYTFHAWYRFHPAPLNGGYANDFVRVVLWLRDANGSLHREGETTGNYWSILGDDILGFKDEWVETRVTTPAVEADRVSMRPFFRVNSKNTVPTDAWTDSWAVTLPYDFTLSQSSRDPADQDVAVVGARHVGAAINNAGELYVSTNGAAGGQDRMIFIWLGGVGAGTINPPWAKAGTIAGPATEGLLLALVQEGDNGYCQWNRYDSNLNSWQIISSGFSCTEQLGQYLVGMLNLPNLLGLDPHQAPALVGFASVGYGTDDGDALVHDSQVPASVNSDGNLDAGETQTIHRAHYLAGKIHN